MWTLKTIGVCIIIILLTGTFTSYTGGGNGVGNLLTFITAFLGMILAGCVGLIEFFYKIVYKKYFKK